MLVEEEMVPAVVHEEVGVHAALPPAERICRYCLEPLVRREFERDWGLARRRFCNKEHAALWGVEQSRKKKKVNRELLTGARL